MIEIKNVSKTFGSLKALDDVSFKVEKGDVFGVIGQLQRHRLFQL